MNSRLAIAMSLFFFMILPACADDTMLLAQSMSKEAIIEQLLPKQSEALSHVEASPPDEQPLALPGERGLDFLFQPVEKNSKKTNTQPKYISVGNREPVKSVAEQAAKDTTGAVSLQVYFDYNSAHLTDKSISELQPLGEALSSDQLKTLNFIVEGHTDAVGNDKFNLILSERRAKSVKEFLVSNYGLAADRIDAHGKGRYQLLDPNNPESAINRRVVVKAIQ